MPETSRDFVVTLPDDNQFTVPVQPSLQASDLLDMAASHCKIKEKSYFGLMIEEDGYRNWLELDKPVLDPSQEIPKGSDAVKVYLSFKYYIDSYQDLQDPVTVELLYLQSRKAIEKGEIVTDDDAVFEMSALVMQATNGPFTTEEEAFKLIQSLPVIPAYVFERQSIKACEAMVIRYYKMLEKLTRGEAIFRYLDIVQSLHMYSYHYFEVKDKGNNRLWLGVGPAGIVECPFNNRNNPSTSYQWINLQNIYYKDKKFSVEVYETNRSPRKGNYQNSSVSMYSWYGKNSKVVMAIWKMVRDQHIFYRNKRTASANEYSGEMDDQQKPGMTPAEILRHLNHKHHHGSISPSSSHSSLSIESAKSNQTTATVEAVAAAKKAQQEMYSALLTKREVLVEELESKLTAYKGLLLKEMQITGVPPEGLTAEEIEKMRTKFSINFKFSKFVLDKNDTMGDEMDELEKQLEVQSAIIEAQKSLVDQAKNRQMKKERKKEVKRAEEKFQMLEGKLYDLRNSGQRRTYSESRFDSPGFSLPPPHTLSSVSPSSTSKRSARHSSPNSSMLLDDGALAKMIFDESNHQISPLVSNQRSPIHKTANMLHDITDIHRPISPNPISTHRHLTTTQSLSYTPQQGSNSYFSDSNRSISHGSGLYNAESNDSFLRDRNRSPRGSAATLPNMRHDGSMYSHDDYRQHFTPGMSSSPNSTPSHHRSHDPSVVQTHATITIPQYSQAHRNSSPDSPFSPSNVRSAYRSSGSAFSPEPPSSSYGYQNQTNLPRQRPHSTHSMQSRGTPPPQGQDFYPRNPPSVGYKEKEMDLQEALLMDQEDEGTLV